MSEEGWIFSADVAKILGMTIQSVVNNARKGIIPGYRFGEGSSTWKFREGEIHRFIQSRRTGPKMD